MANGPDENLRIFLLTDAAVKRACGGRIHQDRVPEASARLVPYIWFEQAGCEWFRSLDDTAGRTSKTADIVRFNIEGWGRSRREAAAIADAVYAKLDGALKVTFGDVTRTIMAEIEPDGYELQGNFSQEAFHGCPLAVEVYK